MTRRQEERSDAIRAEVRRYIEKLDAGEIPNETKPAGIGFVSTGDLGIEERKEISEQIEREKKHENTD